MTTYIFRLWLDEQAIFEADGHFFVNPLLDESQVAAGLFTKNNIGFEPVEDMSLYASIQTLLNRNAHLELLQIMGRRNHALIVALQYAGDYEYFALQDIYPESVSDDMAGILAASVEPDCTTTFDTPYQVTCKDGKIWAVR